MKDDEQPGTDEALNRRLARTFIEKIELERDSAIAAIEQDGRNRKGQALKDAYANALEFHRRCAAQTRQRFREEADLHSARATAHLRRESWRALQRLQRSAVDRLRTALQQRYRDQESQWHWCRLWLHSALESCGSQALYIVLGRDTTEETRRRIENMLDDCPVQWSASFDSTLGAGLTIGWGRQQLDGRIESQLPGLADEVFKRLAEELHIREEEKI